MNKSLYCVQVLLATFNGEQFLPEFLNSLANQKGVTVDLIVSDDGSTDRSLDVVRGFEFRFKSLKIFDGPKAGAAANFLHLLRQAHGDFIALADQDDIWLEDHLINSILRLEVDPQGPRMTYSRVLEFRNLAMSRGELFPPRGWQQTLVGSLTENHVRGCTVVMNSEALGALNACVPKKIVMHDWWINLVISTTGKVLQGDNPEVLYRIHSANTVGGKPSFRVRARRLLTSIRGEEWAPFLQILSLHQLYSMNMDSHSELIIRNFIDSYRSRLFNGRLRLVLLKGRYRRSLVDEVAVRLMIFFRKQGGSRK